jgi:hypothetical protein
VLFFAFSWYRPFILIVLCIILFKTLTTAGICLPGS